MPQSGFLILRPLIFLHKHRLSLQDHKKLCKHCFSSIAELCKHGDNRTRTCDPLHVKQMLSQLSYVPKMEHMGFEPTASTMRM